MKKSFLKRRVSNYYRIDKRGACSAEVQGVGCLSFLYLIEQSLYLFSDKGLSAL